MPTFEFFDRLEPDLTLNEIIGERLRRKKSKSMSMSMREGPYAPAIAVKLRKLREALALTGRPTPKPPVTHMNRTVLLQRLTEFDARLDGIVKGRKGETAK